MSLKKNLSYNFLLSISQVLFPILTIPYLSRIIEPSNIGKISFIDSFAYYFVVIAEFGITTYGIREVARKKQDKYALNTLVSELFYLHIIASAVSVVLYVISIIFLYQKVQDSRLILFSLAFLLSSCFTFEWYFWGKEEFRYITLRSLFTRILGVIAIFILVQKNEDYTIYYAIITGSAVLNTALNGRKVLCEINIKFLDLNWRQHISKIFISYLISIFYCVTLFLDNVLVGIISTTTALGFYSYSMKVIRISSGLITDSLIVFYPRTVALLHSEQQSEMQNIVNYSSRIIFLTALPMCAVIFLLSDTFTKLYFGKMFLPIAENLKILSLIPLIKSLSLFLNKQLLMPYDKELLVLNSLIIGALFFIPSVLILCFFYSYKGAAYSILLSEFVILAVNFYYVKRLHKNISLLDKQTIVQAFVAALFFLPIKYICDFVFENELFKVLVSVFMFAIFYVTFLYLIMKNDIFLLLHRRLKSLINKGG